MTTRETYDAIVVGSGAAGGWAAKELTERGLRTILLEDGRDLDPAVDFTPPARQKKSKLQLVSRAQAILSGQYVQARCMSFSPLTQHLFVNDRENPYATGPGQRFNWYRSRQVGGRLHLWGRNALRISDEQLHPAAIDGFGDDWPISYADLAPWYERVERFLGVHGSAAGIPSIPDGSYDHPLPITAAERGVLDSLAREWPDRPATTCRIVRHNPGRIPLPLVAALQTGRLTLRSNAVVSHLSVDPRTGKATGAVFVDRQTREQHEVHARVVVLCASTIESLRIMLNSKSPSHPRGLGNSSGSLGRYFTDHVMIFEAGPRTPLEEDPRLDPFDFGAQSGIYIPNFRNTGGRREPGFLRGYSLLGSVAPIKPGWFFMAVGEMLPRHENFVELHPARRDAWGIPIPRIHCTHSENENAMVRDMRQTMRDLAQACGLEVDHLRRESLASRLIYRLTAPLVYTPAGALVPGSAVHETGGAGMGDDRTRFVLNRHNQCWDAENVFVTDSASFTTAPFQNPGLTIMALSARAGHYIADQMTRREL